MKPREFILSTGAKIFLGRNAENNDELVKNFRGKENEILHTAEPGSPFCVIEKINPSKSEIKESAIICASKSQDWRDNKSNVKMHQFTGKDIRKTILMKSGSWKLIRKPKVLNVKKNEIETWLKQNRK